MQTVYMGGLTAANHSCPRLSPVASMAACCASPGSGLMVTSPPSGATRSAPAATLHCRRECRSAAFAMTHLRPCWVQVPVTGCGSPPTFATDSVRLLLRLLADVPLNALLHLLCAVMHGSARKVGSSRFPTVMPMPCAQRIQVDSRTRIDRDRRQSAAAAQDAAQDAVHAAISTWLWLGKCERMLLRG